MLSLLTHRQLLCLGKGYRLWHWPTLLVFTWVIGGTPWCDLMWPCSSSGPKSLRRETLERKLHRWEQQTAVHNEKVSISGRNNNGKYCVRGMDVRCWKNKFGLSFWRRRQWFTSSSRQPTDKRLSAQHHLPPNKVSLDRTLSFTCSFFSFPSPPRALLTVTTPHGESNSKHMHSDLKS